VAFLDDESFEPPTRRSSGGGPSDRFGPPDRQQQIMVRRLVAVVVAVVIIILIVLGIRGCLNAREERAYENYVRDLTTLASDSNSVSTRFFDRLEDPGNLSPLEYEAEVQQDRSTMETLVDRAEGLDPPDALSESQDLIVLAFELRRDALTVISDQIATAFAREGSDAAVSAIAGQMRAFLASDVLYARAQDVIGQVLEQEEIAEEAPGSQFLPDEPNWLDVDEVRNALGGVSGAETAEATPGIHGTALLQTTILPTGAVLEEGVPVTAAADGAELEVQVQNQGDSDESDIPVSYEIEGGSEGEETLESIAPGETQTVTLPIEDAPAGETVTLVVRVEPVPGEEIEDNNEAAYEVSFE
jgi:CARDB